MFDLLWKLMRQLSLCIKFFVGSQVLSTKKKDDKKTNAVSCLQKKIQEITAITRPSESEKAIKFGMRIFNGTYMYLLSFSQKLQNFKYEHWDFTHSWRLRNNNFYLNFAEWLTSPGDTKFSKPIEEMWKEELNVFLKRFCTYVSKKEGTLSVRLQKFISKVKSYLGAAIDRFLFSQLLNKPFSVISDPAFTEAK